MNKHDCELCVNFRKHYIKTPSMAKITETVWGHCKHKRELISLCKPLSSKCRHMIVFDAAEECKEEIAALDLLQSIAHRLERLIVYFSAKEDSLK